MSYQQSVNNIIGSVARLGVIRKGFKELSAQTKTAQTTAETAKKLANTEVGGTYVYTPGKVPEEVIQAQKMREANERAARKQELRRIQKENMAYFAGKFWKEQK